MVQIHLISRYTALECTTCLLKSHIYRIYKIVLISFYSYIIFKPYNIYNHLYIYREHGLWLLYTVFIYHNINKPSDSIKKRVQNEHLMSQLKKGFSSK